MKTKTQVLPSATEAMEQIEKNALNASAEDRFVRVMPLGKVTRQGDVYVVRVEDNHPKGERTTDHQLADGVTQGSRHVADQTVKVYLPTGGLSILQGPVVVAPARWTLLHPSHSNVSFPSGTYRTCFPRDFEKEEIARVQD